MTVASITEEEFKTWLTPAAAIKLLAPAISRTAACEAIMSAVTDDLARTTARVAIIRRDEGPEERHSHPLLPSHAWHRQPPTPDESFWDTAKIDLPVTLEREGRDDEDVELGCHGVRFEPEGILAILEDVGGAPEQAQNTRRSEPPRVEAPTPPKPKRNPPTPPPVHAAPSGSEERDWIPAADATDLILPIYENPMLAQQALVSEAAGSRIATRCERFELQSDDGRPGMDGVGGRELNAKFWQDFQVCDREREDWFAGAFIFTERLDISGTRWTRAFGVEFCARDVIRVFRLKSPTSEKERRARNLEGWGKLAEAIEPALRLAAKRLPRPEGSATQMANPPIRKRANPVSPDEIKAWYAALSEADQSLGVIALWAKAKTDHPGRHIPRKLVDPFGENRGNGHRAKR